MNKTQYSNRDASSTTIQVFQLHALLCNITTTNQEKDGNKMKEKD